MTKDITRDLQGVPHVSRSPNDERDAQHGAEHHASIEEEELQVQPEAVAELVHERHDHHDGDQRIRVVARQHLPCASVTGEGRRKSLRSQGASEVLCVFPEPPSVNADYRRSRETRRSTAGLGASIDGGKSNLSKACLILLSRHRYAVLDGIRISVRFRGGDFDRFINHPSWK